MTTQQLGSIGRHVGAWLVTAYGILTAATVAPKLPVPVESILVSFGPVMTLLQHYLSHPSTGSSTVSTPSLLKQVGPVPVQLVQQVQPLPNQSTQAVVQYPNPAPPSPA